MSVLTLKDRELQQHYDNMFAMFTSPGWKEFQEKVAEYAKGVENVRNVAPRTLEFRLGQLDVLDWFLGAQKQYEHAYNMLLAEDNPEEFQEELDFT